MIRIILLTALAIGWFNTAEASPPHWAADVPMLACDGIPCVEAKVGGVSGRAIIDIGDIVSVVDSSDAAAIGADPKSRKATRVDVQIGPATLARAPFFPVPLKDYIAKRESPATAFTIAYSAFRNRILQLDFVAHRVRVSEELTAPQSCDGACGTISYPTFGRKGPAIVVADGFSVDGRPFIAQIDSVYTGGLVIYDSSISKLHLEEAAKSATPERFPFTDGGVTEKKGGAAKIAFADRTLANKAPVWFPTPGVHQPDGMFDGTVGLALIRGRIVTLDFHDNKLSITG